MQQSIMTKHHSLNFNFKAMALMPAMTFKFRQWLFCRRQQFTLRDYFAVSYL